MQPLPWHWVQSCTATRKLKCTCETLFLAAELNLIRPGVDFLDIPRETRDSLGRLRHDRFYNLETLKKNWGTITARMPPRPAPRSRKPLIRKILSCRDYELDD